MKTFLNLKYSFLFLPLLLLSCNKEGAFDCIKTKGNIEERIVTTEYFNSISIHDNIELIISQGAEEQIVMKTGRNLMPKIKFEVKEQVLHIYNTNTCNWVRKFENPKIFITLQDLNLLIHNSHGDITSNGKLRFQNLKIQNESGNGDINLDLEIENLDIFSKTYAKINLTGSAVNLNLNYVLNYGRFSGQDFKVENVAISHMGLNTLQIFPVYNLDCTIGNSGNVEYFNEPEILTINNNSSGQLIQKF